MELKTTIWQGNSFSDERGTLFFNNDFDLTAIKRCYQIEHPNTKIVRAWQGHKQEKKWFSVLSGSFLIALVQPDNWEKPSQNLGVQKFVLKADENQVLFISGGFANGMMALENNSKVMLYSNFTAKESANDNFRFDKNNWFDWESSLK